MDSICAVVFAALGAGCPSDDDITGHPGIGGASEYVGADVCLNCHRDVHASWSESAHARALETLRDVGKASDGECLECHTTGYRAGGFVSVRTTPKFGGVQCESCHGPGAKHVGSRRPEDILRVPLTDVCAACHTGAAQPNHEEWLTSAHARSLESVLGSAGRADSCLSCHSNDYAVAERQNQSRALKGLPPVAAPSIVDADASNDPMEGVGCGSCHAPHGSTHRAQLRAEPMQTCAACHQDIESTPGSSPHAPQFNILSGFGGRGPASDPAAPPVELVGPASVHSALDSVGGCAKCHGENLKVPMPSDEMPNKSGHDFAVALAECVECHGDGVAQLLANRQAEVSARLSALRARAEMLAHPPLTPANRNILNTAILNLDLVDHDGSLGAHNSMYSERLLDAAEALMDGLPMTP